MKKTLRQVLKEVDPGLKVVSGHRNNKLTQADWEATGGVKCPTCSTEVLRVYGPHKQCFKCFYREKGIFLEETTCQKCKEKAALVSCLSSGLLSQKVICPNCGTYVLAPV